MCSYMLSLKVLQDSRCVGSRYSDYSDQTICHFKISKIINSLAPKSGSNADKGCLFSRGSKHYALAGTGTGLVFAYRR